MEKTDEAVSIVRNLIKKVKKPEQSNFASLIVSKFKAENPEENLKIVQELEKLEQLILRRQEMNTKREQINAADKQVLMKMIKSQKVQSDQKNISPELVSVARFYQKKQKTFFCFDKLRKQLKVLEDKQTAMKNQDEAIIKLKYKIQQLETKNNKLVRDIERHRTSILTLKKLNPDKQDRQAKEQDYQQQISQLKKKIIELQKKNQHLQDQLRLAQRTVVESDQQSMDLNISEITIKRDRDEVLPQIKQHSQFFERQKHHSKQASDSLSSQISTLKEHAFQSLSSSQAREKQSLQSKIEQLDDYMVQKVSNESQTEEDALEKQEKDGQYRTHKHQFLEGRSELLSMAAKQQSDKEIQSLRKIINNLNEILAQIKGQLKDCQHQNADLTELNVSLNIQVANLAQ